MDGKKIALGDLKRAPTTLEIPCGIVTWGVFNCVKMKSAHPTIIGFVTDVANKKP